MELNGIISNISGIFSSLPFLGPILGAVVGGVITFAGTRRHHQRQVDREAAKEHFDDLKEHVVKPMLRVVDASSWNHTNHLLNLEAAKEEGRLSLSISLSSTNPDDLDEGFDSSLLEDFLDNHYPQIKKYWSDFQAKHDDYVKVSNDLSELVKNKMEQELKRLGIPYASPIYHNQNDIIYPLDGFSKLLERMFINKQYKEDDVKYEDNVKSILLQGTPFYRCYSTDGHSILPKVRETCNAVANDSDVMETLKKYSHALDARNRALKQFATVLKVLLRKTNLQFKRKWRIMVKCTFVKFALD